MPVINVEAGRLDVEQKRSLVAALTRNASEIMKIPEQAFYVFIKENEADNVGVGGTLLSDRD